MKFTPRDFECWAIQDWVAVSGNGILTAYCKIAWWRGKRKERVRVRESKQESLSVLIVMNIFMTVKDSCLKLRIFRVEMEIKFPERALKYTSYHSKQYGMNFLNQKKFSIYCHQRLSI